ncbi:hypothetical protein vBCtySFA70_00040 [Clostridium phage vB_CtyS-FA70]|nr:hypothetical protein vBCtySFA70_00040 [Clostridium phage vB_CtyS-FA70]
MALPRELKAYINKKIDEEIALIIREKKETAMKYIADERKKRENFFKEQLKPEIDTLTEKLSTFDTDYANIAHLNYDGRDVLKDGIFHFIQLDSVNTDDIEKPFEDRIKEINKKRDRLLIRLSLEKDYDKIVELLAENGIEL